MTDIEVFESSTPSELSEMLLKSFNKDKNETKSYIVILDEHADKKSPDRLFKKIAEARAYANRVSTLSLNYYKWLVKISSYVEQYAEAKYKEKLFGVMNENKDVLDKCKSGEEKIGRAEAIYSDEKEKENIRQYKVLAKNVKVYYNYFNSLLDNLNNTRQDINTQSIILNILNKMNALDRIDSSHVESEDYEVNLDNYEPSKGGVNTITFE